MEVKLAAQVGAVTREPKATIGGARGAKPPILKAGVWGAPAPQREEKAPYFINSGGLLTEGGDYPESDMF